MSVRRPNDGRESGLPDPEMSISDVFERANRRFEARFFGTWDLKMGLERNLLEQPVIELAVNYHVKKLSVLLSK